MRQFSRRSCFPASLATETPGRKNCGRVAVGRGLKNGFHTAEQGDGSWHSAGTAFCCDKHYSVAFLQTHLFPALLIERREDSEFPAHSLGQRHRLRQQPQPPPEFL